MDLQFDENEYDLDVYLTILKLYVEPLCCAARRGAAWRDSGRAHLRPSPSFAPQHAAGLSSRVPPPHRRPCRQPSPPPATPPPRPRPTSSFQFNAGRFDLNTTVAVLTKTLMGMPDNDFTLVCGPAHRSCASTPAPAPRYD